MHPSLLMDHLSAGFRRFRTTWYAPANNVYDQLVAGQTPFAAVVACSDSRVDPVQLLDAQPGELFVIRNVANLVPPHEPDTRHHGVSSALEFAICHLHVPHIIVMGHAHCGGFAKLMEDKALELDSYLSVWMDQARLAKTEVDRTLPTGSPQERQRACELWGIRVSLNNLHSFPWIRDAIGQGELCLHGIYFDMNTGELLYLEPRTDDFVRLSAPEPAPAA